jgi:protein-S-isoprenylcysteine O-methyltransferase Ste14
MVLILLGVALYYGTLPMYIAALCDLLVLNFIFIPFEEAKLLRLFGDTYAAYKRGVRRWI